MELASRWDRLGAVIFDFLIMVIPILIIIWLGEISLGEHFLEGESLMLDVLGSVIFLGTFLLLNGYMLRTKGQSLGKRIMGIRISTRNGEVPLFLRQMLPRYAVYSLLGIIPTVGWTLDLINILFIFRRDKRCIHDFVAKTVVVKC